MHIFSISYLDCIILELHELPSLIREIKVSLLHNKWSSFFFWWGFSWSVYSFCLYYRVWFYPMSDMEMKITRTHGFKEVCSPQILCQSTFLFLKTWNNDLWSFFFFSSGNCKGPECCLEDLPPFICCSIRLSLLSAQVPRTGFLPSRGRCARL